MNITSVEEMGTFGCIMIVHSPLFLQYATQLRDELAAAEAALESAAHLEEAPAAESAPAA